MIFLVVALALTQPTYSETFLKCDKILLCKHEVSQPKKLPGQTVQTDIWAVVRHRGWWFGKSTVTIIPLRELPLAHVDGVYRQVVLFDVVSNRVYRFKSRRVEYRIWRTQKQAW